MSDLLVPLASLPGFDPVGLRVASTATDNAKFPGLRGLFVAHADCDEVRVLWVADDGPENWPAAQVLLDLADAATRDRLARYVAGRVGLEVGSTAPTWAPDRAWDVYGWTLGDNHSPRSVMFMPPEQIGRRPNWIGNRRIPVPGLPDPNNLYDDYRSPKPATVEDGTPLMYCVALGIVAVHVAWLWRGEATVADRPVLHLTNWSSRRLHRGTVYTIMRRPNPQYGQLGAGRVEALTPGAMEFDALKAGRMGGGEYRRRFELAVEHRLISGALAPGRLVATTPTEAVSVADGDTLCCGCSVALASVGDCHRCWAASALVRAGWRVVLDGVELLTAHQEAHRGR